MAKWFESQNRLVQVILLIIPIVGWIIELLVRWSAFLSNKSVVTLVVAIIFTFFGFAWILNVIDIIFLALTGHLMFAKA